MSSELNIEAPRTVDVGAIDRELRNLWREASADKEHPVARACMLTLVVFVDVPDLDTASDMAAELAVHHPSRTILVAVDSKTAESSISAEVSARCHMSFGRREHICSEQVIIRASGHSIEEVHGIVLPLLTSDLPSFLWWRSSRWPQGPSFKSIAANCNRIVLDSSALFEVAPEFLRLSDLVRGQQQGQGQISTYSVADLTWSRMTPWRTALAELYDVPAYRHFLQLAHHFSLSYTPSSSDGFHGFRKDQIPPTVLLAAGWLASRFGWDGPHAVQNSGSGLSLGFNQAGHHLELNLSPRAETGGEGPSGVTSQSAKGRSGYELRIETTIDPLTLFSVGLAAGCIQTRLTIEDESQAPRVVGCGELPEPDLVGEELDILGHDSTYEDAVTAGAAIAAAIANT